MKTVPPAVVRDLAQAFGLDPDALTFLGGGQDWSDGTLWTSPTPSGPLVLKVLDWPLTDPGAAARAHARVDRVARLAARGARIVGPRPGPGGRVFAEAEAEDRRFLAYCYPFVRGRHLTADDPSVRSGAYFRAVGAELGRLHATAAADGLTSDPAKNPDLGGWRQEMAFFRSWCQEPRVQRVWDRLATALEGLPTTAANYGFVHNDAHVWNLVFDPEAPEALAGDEPVLTVIDFDVAGFHWYLGDAATAVYSFTIAASGGIEVPDRAPPPGFEAWAEALFWEGYRRHRDPGPDLEAWWPVFLHYRRCLLFMPLQGETQGQPRWREHWIARLEADDRRLFGG